MNAPANMNELQVGYDVPALPGMDESEIQTPCLILDLDALERNIKKWVITLKRMVCVTAPMAKCINLSTYFDCRSSLAALLAFAAKKYQKRRFLRVVALLIFWSPTKFGIR